MILLKPINNLLANLIQKPEHYLMGFIGTVMAGAIISPLIVVFYKSFHVDISLFESILSFDNYSRFFTSMNLGAIYNSIIIALGSAILSVFMGVTLAWITARTDMPFRSLLQTLNIMPFFVSHMIGAVAWSLLASPKSGLLNTFLLSLLDLENAPFNINSIPGIIWVAALFTTPFIYLFCIGPLQQMDPTLEEASKASGAGWFMTTWRITIPLAGPAILSSLILSFILGVEDLGTPLILGYPYGIQTISTLMFDGINQQYPPDHNFAAALGVLLMFITVFSLIFQRRIMAKRSFATVTGRGYRSVRVDPGWGKYVALGINLLYLLLSVFLPIGTLILVSLSENWTGDINFSRLTTKYFLYLFTTDNLAGRGLKNSLILATLGATTGIIIATIISYTIHRTTFKFKGLLDFVTTLPIAVSGLVMAVGFLVLLIRTPLYGTIWILLVAYVVRYFPYGQRSVSGVILSLSVDLEESSRVCGANWLTTMRRIMVPLVWQGFVGGWLLLFIAFTREVSQSLLLCRNGTETLSVALYGIMINSSVGAMAAFTFIQVALLFTAAFLFLRIAGKEGIRV